MENENINWNSAVFGKFFGPNPPEKSLLQQIVVSRWLKTGTITVHNTVANNTPYYIFVCSHSSDVEALLAQHTAVVDGRIITFRRGDPDPTFTTLNFDTAKLWVRVCDLPFEMLHPTCGHPILKQIGHVEKLDDEDGRFPPKEVYLRGKVHVDLSKPLIPGCYVGLSDGKVTWIQLKYEGVFVVCYKCGIVGHSVSECEWTEVEVEVEGGREDLGRIEGLKEEGMIVMQGPPYIPIYSDGIQGLPNRYRNRNTRVNLISLANNNNNNNNNNGV